MAPTDRRKRITDVFQLAVQRPIEERHRFVERECGSDNTLMHEVESLLSEYQTSFENSQDIFTQSAAAQPAPPPMKRIGKYQVTKEIGSGGFGRVYSAIDPGFGRTVAVKVLSAPGDPDLVQRFRAEATTVANLHHMNIVNVHDFGEQDGAPYLVMEFLEGANLQDLIRQNSLTLLEKIEIMTEVANGLQCAHDRGITHRDVKPANIMRLANGSVKIMDFGIARIATDSTHLTQTGFIIGTLSYMSPEQFNGAPADPQCDIFAYGVTFYELLTGRNPFASPNTGETITRIMTAEPPLVSSLVPGCPEGLDRIVKSTLAKNREARYSSLSDVALDARPIIMELQRGQAGQLYAQANQLFTGGQLDAAQAAVRKVLDFDPVHAAARHLRTQIEQALHRRDDAGRAGSLLDKAEKELRNRQWQDAETSLNKIRRFGLSDPQIVTRLEKADAQIEQARRAERLLITAREELGNRHLTEAFRLVSEVLGADPANQTGKDLLQEVRAGMAQREAQRRLQEEIARAEGLLLIGEAEQALASIAEIEKRHPDSSEAWALRNRAEAQQADEIRKRRLADGAAEAKALLRNGKLETALVKINELLADFPSHVELKALQRHAAERLAAERRAAQIAQLKADAARLIGRQEYDQAIRALEAGVAKLGDDGELTRLLQSAIAGKAVEERKLAVSQIAEEAGQLRRQGKLEEALNVVQRAIQAWGEEAPLPGLLQEISQEIQARDRERAIHDALRKAGIMFEQKKPDAAALVLRQAMAHYGEDPELARLLKLAEVQLQARERVGRVGGICDAVRQLAAARRWQEAFDRAEEGLRAFPGEPVLIAEWEAVRAYLGRERRERAIAETLAKMQPMLADRRVDEATKLLNAKLVDIGKDSRLLDVQRKLAELAARKEEAENIDKVCQEAMELRAGARFDDAVRLLEACEVRYPGAPGIAAALADAKRAREAFRRKKEIDSALARASELVQKGEFESARYALEDVIGSYPDSRELADAVARIRSRVEQGERQREIAQLTASIEQAIAVREWGHAVTRSDAAIERFPREDMFARLKRKAEEGKYKADIDDIEASASAARRAGDLDRAAEIVAAGRQRWDKEKRLRELGDEIEDARAEAGVAAAKAMADAGNYAEAEGKIGEVLARRPKLASGVDLAESIAARKAAARVKSGWRSRFEAACTRCLR
ncbi:MAG: protein kinase [Bryobacteraceae bacterium]|jgi:serine/threonine-protein kinase